MTGERLSPGVRKGVDLCHRHLIYDLCLTSGRAKRDREIAHERGLKLLGALNNSPSFVRQLLKDYFTYQNKVLEQEIWGLKFINPLGIAAGWDKEGTVLNSLALLGFSHATAGTFTPEPQGGRERPRLFWLKEDSGYINRMGFPSAGIEAAVLTLGRERWEKDFIVGASIGPNASSMAKGWGLEDYLVCTGRFLPSGIHFIEDNISTPNTQNVRGNQTPERLEVLLEKQNQMRRKYLEELKKLCGINLYIPIIPKISPDLPDALLGEIVEVCMKKADGISACNTSTDMEIRSSLKSQYKHQPGGISGPPIERKCLLISHKIYEQTRGKLPLIRAGGIRDVRSAWNGIAYGGAWLLQVLTGVAERQTSTPNFAYYINKGLAQKVREHGLSHISQARGRYDLAEGLS